jgi:hypothetical protein
VSLTVPRANHGWCGDWYALALHSFRGTFAVGAAAYRRPAFGRLRGGFIIYGEIVRTSFVGMTPAFRWAQVKRITVRRRGQVRVVLLSILLPVATQACDAVDRCLDRGGSWNPEAEQCDLTVPSEEVSARLVHGDWQVVDFEQLGITALSPEEADDWLGTGAYFADSLATFGTYRCPYPTYRSDTTSAQAFYEGYRVDPSALGFGDTIVSTVLRCPSRLAWPGSRLYHRGSELVASWDGTFFVLHRR